MGVQGRSWGQELQGSRPGCARLRSGSWKVPSGFCRHRQATRASSRWVGKPGDIKAKCGDSESLRAPVAGSFPVPITHSQTATASSPAPHPALGPRAHGVPGCLLSLVAGLREHERLPASSILLDSGLERSPCPSPSSESQGTPTLPL